MDIELSEQTDNFNPYNNLLCIRFPGIVNNPEKAIEAIGGLTNLIQWYNQSDRSLLPLLLDHTDHAKRGSFGRLLSPDNRRILVKLIPRFKRVTYSDGSIEDIEMEPRVQVLGVVADYVTFDAPIDYQYKARIKPEKTEFVTSTPLEAFSIQSFYDAIKNTNLIDLSALDSSEALRTLDFIPPSLAVKLEPRNYRWVFTHKKAKGEDEEGFGHTFKVNAVINHWDKSTVLNQGIRKEDESVFLALSELFASRPCWTRRELLWQVETQFGIKYPSSAAKRCLPYIAYSFTDGPFRNVLCRWNYDPRTDPAARYFQIIDFRGRGIKKATDLIQSMMTMSDGRASSRHGDKGSEMKERECPPLRDANNYVVVPAFVTDTENVSGVAKTHFQSMLSVVDLNDERVLRILDHPSSSFTEKFGWLSEQSIENIRIIIRKKIEQIAVTINREGMDAFNTIDNSYASIVPIPFHFWEQTSQLKRDLLVESVQSAAGELFQSIINRTQPVRKRKGRHNTNFV